MVSVFSAIIQVIEICLNKASFYLEWSSYHMVLAPVKPISTHSLRPPAFSKHMIILKSTQKSFEPRERKNQSKHPKGLTKLNSLAKYDALVISNKHHQACSPVRMCTIWNKSTIVKILLCIRVLTTEQPLAGDDNGARAISSVATALDRMLGGHCLRTLVVQIANPPKQWGEKEDGITETSRSSAFFEVSQAPFKTVWNKGRIPG